MYTTVINRYWRIMYFTLYLTILGHGKGNAAYISVGGQHLQKCKQPKHTHQTL